MDGLHHQATIMRREEKKSIYNNALDGLHARGRSRPETGRAPCEHRETCRRLYAGCTPGAAENESAKQTQARRGREGSSYVGGQHMYHRDMLPHFLEVGCDGFEPLIREPFELFVYGRLEPLEFFVHGCIELFEFLVHSCIEPCGRVEGSC